MSAFSASAWFAVIISANTKAGFSIGTFTKGSGTETVAHGLNTAPNWYVVKRLDSTGSWFIIDSVRDIASLGAANTEGSSDSQHKQLFADAGDAEGTYNSSAGDFTSNGYKLRSTNNSTNASGGTFIYFAFAEHPFVTSEGTPVTAI